MNAKWLAIGLAAMLSHSALAQTWTGAGADSDWSDPLNWDSGLPTLPATLTFDGSQRLSNSNNWAASSTVSGLIFAPTAGSFILGGNALTLSGSIVNCGAALQTIALNLALSGSTLAHAAAGDLRLNGNLTGSGSLTVIGANWTTLAGASNTAVLIGSADGAGKLRLAADQAAGTWQLFSGTLDLAGYNLSTQLLGAPADAGAFSLTNSAAQAATLAVNVNTTAGGLQQAVISGNVSLLLSGGYTSTSLYPISTTNNTFTGSVTFTNAGSIRHFITVSNAGFFGAAANTVVFNGSGGLHLNIGNGNWDNPVQINGQNNALMYSGNSTIRGQWTGAGDLQIYNNFGPTLTFANDMSGFTGKIALESYGWTNSGWSDRFVISGGGDWSQTTLQLLVTSTRNGGANQRSALNVHASGNQTVKLGDLTTYSPKTGGADVAVNDLSQIDTKTGVRESVILSNNAVGTATFEVGYLNKSGTFGGRIIDSGYIDNPSTGALNGVITGAKVALTKVGAGALTLSGSSDYTGATTVSGGVLLVSGSGSINATSGVTVSAGGELAVNSSVALAPAVTVSGGKLGGSGELGGSVQFSGGGTVTGGGFGTAGTLAFSAAQTWQNFTYAWDLLDAAHYDVLSFSGGLTLSGNNYTLTVSNPGAVAFTELLVIEGNVSGFDDANWSVTGGYTLTQKADGLWLSVTPVPEPSALALWLTGALFAIILSGKKVIKTTKTRKPSV